MQNRKQEIKKILSNYIPIEESIKLQFELNEIAKNYEPKYSNEEYISFLERHPSSFDKGGRQDSFLWEMFSGISQQIDGDSLKECLDWAIDIENGIRKLKWDEDIE